MTPIQLTFRYAVRDYLGAKRTQNQDSAYASPRLIAVADGMGGHAGGDVASSLAIEALLSRTTALENTGSIGDLVDLARLASASIREEVERDARLSGMGTTLTMVQCNGSAIELVHIGDSRAYLLRDTALTLLTHDDTHVQTLVDAGELTPEQARVHPLSSVVTRVLTGQDIGPTDPQLATVDAQLADRWLICSDGLSGAVPEETLLGCLSAGDDVDATADALVRVSKEARAGDNVTVIVADVVADGAKAPAATERLVVGAVTNHRRAE